MIDGIQVATGCTPGKGNLRVRNEGIPRATFYTEGKSLRTKLREAWTREFLGTTDPEELARRVLYLPEELSAWEISP